MRNKWLSTYLGARNTHRKHRQIIHLPFEANIRCLDDSNAIKFAFLVPTNKRWVGNIQIRFMVNINTSFSHNLYFLNKLFYNFNMYKYLFSI